MGDQWLMIRLRTKAPIGGCQFLSLPLMDSS
jgi:hypothetical protein